MLVAVDVGNSAVKFGAFDGVRLVASERIEAGRTLVEDVIPPAQLTLADEVAALASSPVRAREFEAWCPRPVTWIDAAARAAFRTSYVHVHELGLDRIAALAGARALTGAARVAVVDAGTAVTVDALTADGTLVAVAIAPGLRAASRGLREAAPHLPAALAHAGDVRIPATCTADSLRVGALLGLAGAVDRLLEEAARAVGGLDAVVLTGGDAAALGPHLRTQHRLEAHVVLHGIRTLYEARDR